MQGLESLYFSLFGLTGVPWLKVAFLVCVLVAVTFRPEHVRHAAMFKIAVLAFAASIVLPSALLMLTSSSDLMSRSSSGSTVESGLFLWRMSIVLGKALFAMGVILAVFAMLPTWHEIPRNRDDDEAQEDQLAD